MPSFGGRPWEPHLLIFILIEIKELPHQIYKENKDDKNASKRKNSKVFIPLRDQELWFIFKQVIAGVRYLHYQNIVHGDIKPQNILVSEDRTVKLADFGISKMLESVKVLPCVEVSHSKLS